MKIIPKFASGAGLPFSTYEPIIFNGATNSYSGESNDGASKASSSSSEDTKGEITNKDLLTLMKEIDGLPSDMLLLYDTISKFYKYQELGIPNTSSLSTLYLNAILQIKTAKYHKEVFDEAYKNLVKNGADALNEIAITDTGKVAVLTDNGIEFKSVDDLKGQQPLTNADLLQLRAEQMPGADKYTAIAGNGIGISKVAELIKSNLQSLGEESNTAEGYISGKTLEGFLILQDLRSKGAIAEGTDLQGLYKAKIITKELKSKVESVFKYALQMLPTNARTLLTYKAGSNEDAIKLVYDMVMGTTKNSRDIELDYIEDKEGNKVGTSKTSDKDSSETSDMFTNLIRGLGGTRGLLKFLNSDGYSMDISGVNYADLSLNPSHRVKECVLNDLFEVYGLLSILKGGNYSVTFGNQALDKSDMKDIVYLNDSKNIRAILPTTTDDLGNIVPDIEFINSHRDLIDLINTKGLNSPEVSKILTQEGYINADGSLDLRRFQPYLCVNGMGSSRNIKENTIKKEITDEKRILLFEHDVYKKKGDGDEGKEYKFDWDYQNLGGLWPGDWFGLYDKLYEGTIYIPLTDNVIQTKIGSGTTVSQNKTDNLERIYLQGDLRISLNTQTTSSDVL